MLKKIIIHTSQNGKTRYEEVNCLALVRDVPDRRLVFDATWNEKPVILKLYTDTFAANRHLRNEWDRLTILNSRKVRGPEPLFYGVTDSGEQALVMEKITDAKSAYNVWLEQKDKPTRTAYMTLLLKALAEQHEKGIIQMDLQLDNFLFKNNILYPLDAYQMRFFSGSVNRKLAIDQVALLASQYREPGTDFQDNILQIYGELRGWTFKEKEREFFQSKVEHYIQMRLKKRVRKFSRNNRRHIVMKRPEYFGVFDRQLFVDSKEAEDFIERLDTMMDSGEILKNGNTCYLSRINWKGWDIVVKRYNNQGYWHCLKVTMGQSRAKICWDNAIRLGLLQIPTPKPFVFVEKRTGSFIHTSYFITEYIPSVTCRDYLLDNTVPESNKRENVQMIIHMLNCLEKNRISHGDMKHLNFLVSDKGPFLIDLDGMRFHRWRRFFSKRWSKDMSRFRSNWNSSPELLDFFHDFLISTRD